MLDCKELTYQQMADIIRAIKVEVKERNPLFVDCYVPSFKEALNEAVFVLEELSEQFEV